MQGIYRILRPHYYPPRAAIFQQYHGNGIINPNKLSSGFGCVTTSPPMQQKGLENVTVSEVLMTKGEDKNGSWLWCRVDDAVINAMKNMAENNIGSLVVLNPEGQHIAGIVTERVNKRKMLKSGFHQYQHTLERRFFIIAEVCVDENRMSKYNHSRKLNLFVGYMLELADCLKKIIAQGRSPLYTQVGQIMTDENNLITVTSGTNILQAMRLMIENHIRHVPVIDGKIVGMISIVDVVRAVMEQQGGELKRLNDYIKGDYY